MARNKKAGAANSVPPAPTLVSGEDTEGGGDVAIVNDTGDIGYAPRNEADYAIKRGDARVATSTELAREQARVNREQHLKELQGARGTLIAGAAGLARGFTGGLSDTALIEGTKLLTDPATAEAVRHSLAEHEAANPTTSALAQAAGLFVPGNLIGQVGKAAGAAGEAFGLGKLAAGALTGAAEGSALGAGDEVSKAALENKPLTAQTLVAGAGLGGLLGGAIGGGVAALGRGLETAATRNLRETAEKPGLTAGLAEQLAVDSLGMPKAYFKRLSEFHNGDVRGAGKILLEEVPQATGKRFARTAQEEFPAAIQSRLEHYGDVIDNLLTKTDSIPSGPKVSKQALISRITDEIYAPLAMKVGGEAEASEVGKYVKSLNDKLPEVPTFKELQEVRRNLDTFLKGPDLKKDWRGMTGGYALMDIRNLLEDELIAKGEQAAAQRGGTFAKEYTDAKYRYGSLSKMLQGVEERVASKSVNASIGLLDRVVGAGSTMAGALGGGVPGALLAGGAAMVSSKLLRERGNQVMADLLSRSSLINSVASKAVDVEKTIGTRLSAAAPAVAATSLGPQAAFGAQRVLAAVNRPVQQHMAQLEKNTGEISATLPAVGQDIHATQMRAIQYMQQSVPPAKTYGVAHTILDKPKLSVEQSARIKREATTLSRPLSTLKDLKNGELLEEQVRAISTVYPDLYLHMREKLMENLMQKSQVSIKTLERASVFAGQPLVYTSTPEFFQAIQAVYEEQPTEEPRATSRPLSLPNQATEIQKLNSSE